MILQVNDYRIFSNDDLYFIEFLRFTFLRFKNSLTTGFASLQIFFLFQIKKKYSLTNIN